MEYPFLIRTYDQKVTQAQTLRVFHAEKRKVVGQIGGVFNEVKTYGYDHSRINIRGLDCINAFGRKESARTEQVPKTAAGIKTALRRLRPQEAERIAAVDAEIERLTAEIERLTAELEAKRRERKALVGEAWTKANVVPLSHLTILPDPPLPR